ncbi:DUF3426 domain-containing protein [Cognatiluteimonas telluris]|uniref:DUF3426 domain-containing protein n=1 Tax=Cognatiluteimonas telluris TaxID=1104775 RepID=UPI00311AA876
MFVLCPHCQFLVTVDRGSGAPPARCPRCRGLVAPMAMGSSPASDDLSAAMAALAPPASIVGTRAATRGDAVDALDSGTEPPGATVPDTSLPWNTPPAPPIDAPLAAMAMPPAGKEPRLDVAGPEAVERDGVHGSPAGDAASPDESVATQSARPQALPTKQDGEVPTTGTPLEEATIAGIPAAAGEATPPAGQDPLAPAAPAPPARATPARSRRRRKPGLPRIPGLAFVRSARLRRWRAPVAIAALTLLLALQMLLADRAQLAADARWRPWLQAMCDVLACDLPPWRQPEAFRLVERNVSADPQRTGVLNVRARFRNDARWAQPLPAIALTLSDADGRTLGARVFTPGEYLAPGTTQNGIASGQLATVSIDVVEPAQGVVAFTFEFR